ncbi:hypothetical protein ACFPK1_02075 [Actinomycetospora rhizophila]|uniref:Secreted protein n=1 Tax=Actinomycetospora rhizophila TaxID=1416876 RepID=A0ABV9Z770_9PSEU
MVARRLATGARTAVVCAIAVLVSLAAGPHGRADPLPGFDLDPVVLEQRVDDCIAGAASDKFLLAGWIKISTGEQRRWYCSSLKHMYLRAAGGSVHDPFVDVPSFLACTDRTVSYGFPRPGDPGNTQLIYQYLGTSRRAVVIVNDSTGDVVSIYTTPADDWTTCARWSP